MKSVWKFTGLAVLALSISCARPPATMPDRVAPLQLPSALQSRAEVLPPDAPGYALADLSVAVRPPGEGNVSRALAVRLTQDLTVFRMWSGPEKKDASGFTNRIGPWWTFEPPRGSVETYRATYEVCRAWNDLTWVVSCTMRKGTVVAAGPGNSVSPATCNDPSGKERYSANPRQWQIYVADVFTRVGPGKDIECQDPSADYQADPRNIAKPVKGF